MATQRTLKLNLLADVEKFGKGLAKAGRDAQTFGDKVKAYGKIAAGALAAVGAAAGAMAIKLGVDAVKGASDLNEEVNKTEVVFGETAAEIKAFAKTADKALGLTETGALKAASTFAILGKNAGLTGRQLSGFAKESAKIAADLGSFFNTSTEDAITAIGSALRGEAEPIRKYGVLISAAALEEAAFNYEIRTGTELQRDAKNQLTEQSKVLARYQIILDQTKDAQGDFGRTSDSVANSQKILAAQIVNLKAQMGENLLPVMQSVIMQASKMASAFGGDDPEALSERARELAGTYDGQGSGAYNLGLALRNVAKAFGEIFKALSSDEAANGNTALQTFANALNLVANGIERVADAYTRGKNALEFIGRAETRVQDFLGIPNVARGPLSRAAGGSVMGGQAYRVGEFGSEIFVPSGSGSIRPDKGGGGNTFIFNGVIDGESARRSIEKLLQDSARRTGAINLVGANL